MADAYANMLEVPPEYPMSEVLSELGVVFDADSQLTQLEAWLLYVALGPANETTDSTVSRRHDLLVSSDPAALAEVKCDQIKGDGSDSGYWLAETYGKAAAGTAEGAIVGELAEGAVHSSSVTTVAQATKAIGDFLGNVTKILDVAQMAQIFANVDISVDTEPTSTHKPHENQTKEDKHVEITVRVMFTGVTAATESACQFAGLLDLPPAGPIEGAQVDIDIGDELNKHGSLRRRDSQNSQRASADAQGEVVVRYEPDFEKPKDADELGDTHSSRRPPEKQSSAFRSLAPWVACSTRLPHSRRSSTSLASTKSPLRPSRWDITIPPSTYPRREPSQAFGPARGRLTSTHATGVDWVGTYAANSSAISGGATLTLVNDSEISFVMPEGANRTEAPLLIDSTFGTLIQSATVTNNMAQTGTIIVEFPTSGSNAIVTMDLEAGSQDISIVTPDASVGLAGSTDAYTMTFNPEMLQNVCSGS